MINHIILATGQCNLTLRLKSETEMGRERVSASDGVGLKRPRLMNGNVPLLLHASVPPLRHATCHGYSINHTIKQSNGAHSDAIPSSLVLPFRQANALTHLDESRQSSV